MRPAHQPGAHRCRSLTALLSLWVLLLPLAAHGETDAGARAFGMEPAPATRLARLASHTPVQGWTPPIRSIVLVTLDTTRADHLSCYGYPWLTTPAMDQVAAQGIRFTRASTVIPLTGPAHASLLTGLSPREHGAIRNGVGTNPAVPTLATLLAARGFATAAFISGWTLRDRITGLGRGFDLYDDDMTDRYKLVNNRRPGDRTTDRALLWLKKNAQTRFFLWLHLFDAHAPNNSHGFKPGRNPLAVQARAPRPHLVERYDQEIQFEDHQVARLLQALQEAGIKDTTLLVLTADHGESLGEHGERGHGRRLFETTQHIPLILAHPSLTHGKGLISDLPVTSLDITPTLLHLLGLPALPASHGMALDVALQAPGSFLGRTLYQETYPGARKRFWRWLSPAPTGRPLRVALFQGGWKAILNPSSGGVLLFDLAADPGETTDLATQRSARLDHFLPLLAQYAQKKWRRLPPGDRLNDSDRRRLRSLGYVN